MPVTLSSSGMNAFRSSFCSSDSFVDKTLTERSASVERTVRMRSSMTNRSMQSHHSTCCDDGMRKALDGLVYCRAFDDRQRHNVYSTF